MITKPHTPNELVDQLFSSCPEDEAPCAVLQQELIIACADLVSILGSRLFRSREVLKWMKDEQ